MKIEALGHVVVQVRDIKTSEAFYQGLLGLPVCAREPGKMSFFTLGNHHDFAILAVGKDAPGPDAKGVGLAHVAFKVGDSLDDLRAVKAELDAAGVECLPIDHEVSLSLYCHDPDGNQVELYVDVSDVWKEEPERVNKIVPLEL